MKPIILSLGEIGQVEVLVRGLEQAIEFYKEKLGNSVTPPAEQGPDPR